VNKAWWVDGRLPAPRQETEWQLDNGVSVGTATTSYPTLQMASFDGWLTQHDTPLFTPETLRLEKFSALPLHAKDPDMASELAVALEIASAAVLALSTDFDQLRKTVQVV